MLTDLESVMKEGDEVAAKRRRLLDEKDRLEKALRKLQRS